MLASGKFLALHCCRRYLVCILARSVVVIYQRICSALFSCLDWHSLAFLLCCANVNRELVSRLPVEMPKIITIVMIMAMLAVKKLILWHRLIIFSGGGAVVRLNRGRDRLYRLHRADQLCQTFRHGARLLMRPWNFMMVPLPVRTISSVLLNSI